MPAQIFRFSRAPGAGCAPIEASASVDFPLSPSPGGPRWKQFYRKFPQYREATITAREFEPGERVEVDYAGDPATRSSGTRSRPARSTRRMCSSRVWDLANFCLPGRLRT